ARTAARRSHRDLRLVRARRRTRCMHIARRRNTSAGERNNRVADGADHGGLSGDAGREAECQAACHAGFGPELLYMADARPRWWPHTARCRGSDAAGDRRPSEKLNRWSAAIADEAIGRPEEGMRVAEKRVAFFVDKALSIDQRIHR